MNFYIGLLGGILSRVASKNFAADFNPTEFLSHLNISFTSSWLDGYRVRNN